MKAVSTTSIMQLEKSLYFKEESKPLSYMKSSITELQMFSPIHTLRGPNSCSFSFLPHPSGILLGQKKTLHVSGVNTKFPPTGGGGCNVVRHKYINYRLSLVRES
jgi:hypothetical protein